MLFYPFSGVLLILAPYSHCLLYCFVLFFCFSFGPALFILYPLLRIASIIIDYPVYYYYSLLLVAGSPSAYTLCTEYGVQEEHPCNPKFASPGLQSHTHHMRHTKYRGKGRVPDPSLRCYV